MNTLSINDKSHIWKEMNKDLLDELSLVLWNKHDILLKKYPKITYQECLDISDLELFVNQIDYLHECFRHNPWEEKLEELEYNATQMSIPLCKNCGIGILVGGKSFQDESACDMCGVGEYE